MTTTNFDIRFSCQTYAWQMGGDRYKGRMDHILKVVDETGFAAIEAEPVMLGGYSDIERAHQLFDPSRVQLSSVAFVASWRNGRESEEERAAADHFIEFVRSFHGARMVLVQAPGPNRNDLGERQKNAIACINSVARRATDAGVSATFHPNSPKGSVFRTRDDYQTLLDGLDERVVRYTPDAGHIAVGGMDPLSILKEYREVVDHIHLKDFTPGGGWAVTGEGEVDFPGIVTYLRDTGYKGWVVVEEESPAAEADPDAAAAGSAAYVRAVLEPLVHFPA